MKLIKYCCSILFFVFFFSTKAQSVREHINFDKDWRFRLGHAANGEEDFNYSIAPIFSKSGKAETTAIDPNFDDSEWRKLNVPHDWVVELPFVKSENFDVMAHGYKPVGGLFPENSIGWYRKKFPISEVDSGKRFSIQFDGVFRNSKVWLNGFYLGGNESGYIGETFDITDFVNFKKDNVLVVRVDASQYEGWFYEGAGIYRHVWLNKYNNLHIRENGVFVHTKVESTRAKVFAEVTLDNKDTTARDVKIVTYITERDKGIQFSKTEAFARIPAGRTHVQKQELEVENAKLWSVENPYLYKLHTIITENGGTIDHNTERFGVRTFEVSRQNELLLNGKVVKLKGVNCHQDHAGVGSALPDYLQYYRIRLLKEFGANAYRSSHHAPTRELLEACDSLGMLVMDETRLLNSAPEYMEQFEKLILRDRNHPSIFMWSIGNEEGYAQKNSFGKRIALSMLARQRKLDPTRTSTYAADLGNEFTGINEVIPVRGFNYREKFIIPYHNDHPGHPIIGTEMGSTVTTRGIYALDSVKGYLPDQDIHAPWWASKAEAWWPIAADNAWVMGGFIWTGFDYRGEPTPFKWPNISSHFGIMDVCGFPKNIYYYYQSWWTDKDVLHISPHWNWKGKEGQPIEVWVNSNAENVELFLNGRSLGKKNMPRNSHLKWNVQYKAGTLQAIAFKDGKQIQASIETTDSPAKIVLSVDQKIILADGQDATVVNVSVVDRKGNIVPDAMNPIVFRLSGPGQIIGTGNGDPSSHEKDSYFSKDGKRNVFNGKCQIIIQSEQNEGTIKLEAISPGLEKALVSIQAKSKEFKVSSR